MCGFLLKTAEREKTEKNQAVHSSLTVTMDKLSNQVLDMGESTMVVVHPEMGGGVDIGSFLFRHQSKFVVLETLVLVELMITSSSVTIHTLGGCGIAIVWLFTIVMREEQAQRALGSVFPRLLICSTVLLTAIVLIKVFFIGEEADLSLFFLGTTFAGDHILLALEVVPSSVQFILAGGTEVAQNQQSYGVFRGERKRNHILQAIQDRFVCLVLAFVYMISTALIAVHAILVFPIRFLISECYWKARFVEWQAEENADRQRSGGHKKKLDDKTTRAGRVSLNNHLLWYITVVLVDIEFLAIGLAVAFFSGGAQIGGTSFVQADPNQACCCGNKFIGNGTAC